VGPALATSLSHPGANLAGISLAFAEGLGGKWLRLLGEMLPQLSTVAVIGNPARPWITDVRGELEIAARAQGLTLHLDRLNRAYRR